MEDDGQLNGLTHDAGTDSEFGSENNLGSSNNSNNVLPSVVSGLFSAGQSLLGTLLSGWFTQRAMAKQHEYNIADWQMQNQYDLPANQMQRMVAAGISPAAAAKGISGNGAASNGINPTAQGNPEVKDATGLQSLLANFPNLMLDQRNSEVQRDLMAAEREYYKALSREKNTLLPYQVAKIAQENLNLAKVGELTDAQAENYRLQTQRLLLLTPLELEKFLADIDTANALRDKYYAETDKTKAETRGIEYDNVKKAYEAAYIKAYHADPNSNVCRQFVQMCLGGDEQGGNVFDAFVGTAKSIVKRTFKRASEFYEGVEKHMPWAN